MRITPADAGKTTFMADIAACIWDHPRRCGENQPLIQAQPPPDGSPPRMRGKPAGASRSRTPTRITPAHAGKTKTKKMSQGSIKDHPRACGENRCF